MLHHQDHPAQSGAASSVPEIGRRRLCAAGATLAGALLLSACGGGGDGGYARPPRTFAIGVTVSGQPGSVIPISPGGSLAMNLRAGQSVNLDAGEPVVWNLYIGASQVSQGVQVVYGGVTIDTRVMNAYAVLVSTYAPYQFPEPVNVMLVATSTYDNVQVATVYLSIVN